MYEVKLFWVTEHTITQISSKRSEHPPFDDAWKEVKPESTENPLPTSKYNRDTSIWIEVKGNKVMTVQKIPPHRE